MVFSENLAVAINARGWFGKALSVYAKSPPGVDAVLPPFRVSTFGVKWNFSTISIFALSADL